MAHSVSAKKRIRQNKTRQERNRARKSRVRSEIRKVREAVGDGNTDDARARLQQAGKIIDQIASKGTIHKNKAARLKSRLAKRVNALQQG